MTTLPPITQADLDHEARGTSLGRAAREAFWACAPARRLWREILVISSAPTDDTPHAGRGLISRRPPETQGRYETLAYAEQWFPGPREPDFGFLIGPACAILEEEVDNLLAQPVRPAAAALIEKLARVDRNQAALLERWVGGRSLTTLGITSILLRAVRHALDEGDEVIAALLAGHFTPGFIDLIRSNQVAKSLDRIRDSYRNHACHGTRPFDAAAYAQFNRLLLGRDRVAAWEAEGPSPLPPPPETALLHHLLCGSRLLPEVALPPAPVGPDRMRRAIDRMSALARPRPGGLRVEVVPHHAGAEWRDVTVSAARAEQPIRLGDEIRFSFRVDQDCHVTLIDVGASGNVCVLLPNHWSPSPRAIADRVHRIPGEEFAGFALTLGGSGGRERVVALATRRPPPEPLLPRRGEAFRRLDHAALDEFVEAVERLDHATWGAAACEFMIEAR